LGGDRAFLFAPAGGHEDQLGELRLQALDQSGHIATQCAEVGDQDVAAAADQIVDGRVCGRNIPQSVLGPGG
jgi:hypothetical protein